MGDAQEVERIDIKEFRAEGYLQEANRRFFHPLGLALEVIIDEEGNEELGGIWDYRDDPEGILYQEGVLSVEKFENVKEEWKRKAAVRRARYGMVEQPVEKPEDG